MPSQLFVYGTLTDPETQKKVIGKTVDGVPDVLNGYKKSTIVIFGNSYPDIVKALSSSVDGLIIPVTTDELELIDNYETDWYKRIEVVL
ncbi:MAG: gamma-glutamylcyclotransferase, partial [Anaerolineales bacterium]|nr:gamma-glutamylcyclotransferase [Anaerolineales bacterium]